MTLDTLDNEALLLLAARTSRRADGAQWYQGEICIEVQRRTQYGDFDVQRYAVAAGKAKTTLYGYARTVNTFAEAGLYTWGDFSQRFPGCGFTVARDVVAKLQDSVAAVSYLEARAERTDDRKWAVESVRGDLRNIMTPDAPKRVATYDDVEISFDVLIDGDNAMRGAEMCVQLTPDQYTTTTHVDRKARYRVVLYMIGGAA